MIPVQISQTQLQNKILVLGQSNRQLSAQVYSNSLSLSKMANSPQSSNYFTAQNSTQNSRTNKYFSSQSQNIPSIGYIERSPVNNQLFSSQVRLMSDSIQTQHGQEDYPQRNSSSNQRRYSLAASNQSTQIRMNSNQLSIGSANSAQQFASLPQTQQQLQISSAQKPNSFRAACNGQNLLINRAVPTFSTDYQNTELASGNNEREMKLQGKDYNNQQNVQKSQDNQLKQQYQEQEITMQKLIEENNDLTNLTHQLNNEGKYLKEQLKNLQDERIKYIHREHDEEKVKRMKLRVKELEEENQQTRQQCTELESILLEQEAKIKTFQEIIIGKGDSSTNNLINVYINNEEKYKNKIKELEKQIKQSSSQIGELTASLNEQQINIQQKDLSIQQLQGNLLNEKLKLHEENCQYRKQIKQLQTEQNSNVKSKAKTEEESESLFRESISHLNTQIQQYTDQLNQLQDKYDLKSQDVQNALYKAEKKSQELKEQNQILIQVRKEKDDVVEKLKVMMHENDNLAELLQQKANEEQIYLQNIQLGEKLNLTIAEQNKKIGCLEKKVQELQLMEKAQIETVQTNEELNVQKCSLEDKLDQKKQEIIKLNELIEEKNQIILKKVEFNDEKITLIKEKELGIRQLQDNLNTLQSQYKAQTNLYQLSQEQLEGTRKEVTNLQEQLDFQVEQIQNYKLEKNDFNKRLEIHDQLIEQKNNRISESQKTIDTLQVRVDELTEVLQNAQGDLNQKEEFIIQLTSSIDNLQSVLKQIGSDQQSEMTNLKENYSKESQYYQTLNAELEKEYTKKIEEKNKKINQIEDRIKFYKKEVSQLNNEAKEQEEQIILQNLEISNLKEKYSRLYSEHELNNNDLKESKLIQSLQEEKLTNYTTQISEFQFESLNKQELISKLSLSFEFYNNLEKQLNIFEQKIKELEVERAVLNNHISDNESSKIESAQKIKQLEDKLVFTENTLQEQQKILEEKEKEVNLLQRSIQEIEKHQNISTISEGFSFIKSTYEFIKDKENGDEKVRQTELSLINHKIQQYQIENQKLNSLVKEYTSQIEYLRGIQSKYEQEAQEYSQKIINLQDQFNIDMIEKSKLEEELNEVKEQKCDLKSEVNKLQNQIIQSRNESTLINEEINNLNQNLGIRKEKYIQTQKQLFEANQQLAFAFNQLQQQQYNKSNFQSPLKSTDNNVLDHAAYENANYIQENPISNNENSGNQFYTNNDTLVSNLTRSVDSNV